PTPAHPTSTPTTTTPRIALFNKPTMITAHPSVRYQQRETVQQSHNVALRLVHTHHAAYEPSYGTPSTPVRASAHASTTSPQPPVPTPTRQRYPHPRTSRSARGQRS